MKHSTFFSGVQAAGKIWTTNDTIRERAMLKDWNLIDLHTNSMKYENPAASEEKISGVHINKLGAYSYHKLADKSSQPRKPSNPEKNDIDVVWDLQLDT